MLSLLTKIDDQIIDARPFHADRVGLVARTRAFLAPTLASIREARAANAEPRCALGAALGRSLRALAADEGRLDRVLATIAAGWEVQVEAVRVLTSAPDEVSRAEVAQVTRSISGVWLLMIARIGELPADARRPFTADEERSFYDWGWAIQRVDALADLAKDLGDGHLATWPGMLLWERAPAAYLDAATRGDAGALHALLRAHGVERACMPDANEAAQLAASLPELGDVRALLAFIHEYLHGRWLAHPLHAAAPVPVAAARLFPTKERSCSAR
ncbi:Hypothetical protein A7982_11970 [Minicystis rosea]|nr:Hypothetical protein A7982_11970 [Minicystis rosea]